MQTQCFLAYIVAKVNPNAKLKGSHKASTSTCVGKGKGVRVAVGKGGTRSNAKSQGKKLEGNKISVTNKSSM